jgi:hypothetical protein
VSAGRRYKILNPILTAESTQDMFFPKRENIEAIGESFNRQLRVPRQNAFKTTSPDKPSSRELLFLLNIKRDL